MPRSDEKNQVLREDRRQKILSAAVRIFALRGLSATKVSDIAQAVGMSKGLLYHYYCSKDEIFVEIVRSAFEKMNGAAMDLEKGSQSPREKLRTAVSKISKSLDESDDFAWFSVLISVAGVSDATPPEARELLARERDVAYQVIAKICAAGQKEGTVRPFPAMDLAVVFWNAVKGLALHKVTLGKNFKSPDPHILERIFFEE